jgi:hypothetical protein
MLDVLLRLIENGLEWHVVVDWEGSGARPASYTMGTGGKAAGAWRWPPTPSSAEVK